MYKKETFHFSWNENFFIIIRKKFKVYVQILKLASLNRGKKYCAKKSSLNKFQDFYHLEVTSNRQLIFKFSEMRDFLCSTKNKNKANKKR